MSDEKARVKVMPKPFAILTPTAMDRLQEAYESGKQFMFDEDSRSVTVDGHELELATRLGLRYLEWRGVLFIEGVRRDNGDVVCSKVDGRTKCKLMFESKK